VAARILVVDDDPGVGAALQRALAAEGHQVELAVDGPAGLAAAAARQPDLVVLDVRLPGLDGIAVCRRLREGGAVPILMLTALGAPGERVRGLDSGADDYLVKPFHMGELMARVRALLRRDSTAKSTRLQVDDLVLDTSSHLVIRGDTPIELTSKEYAILEYFMRHPNQVLTRTMISEHVWDDEFDSFSNIIDVYIRRLRRKIDDPAPTL